MKKVVCALSIVGLIGLTVTTVYALDTNCIVNAVDSLAKSMSIDCGAGNREFNGTNNSITVISEDSRNIGLDYMMNCEVNGSDSSSLDIDCPNEPVLRVTVGNIVKVRYQRKKTLEGC